ncbi:DMT family transporter [Hafnia paralvei]|uniref:DMT family transporter n=1 Tax=Hafnia paralvei TaxID=546367 RepID=UPI00241D4B90|nr:EamA family transporter [Hafnia paralvei]
MNILIAFMVPLLWGSTYAVVGYFLQDISPVWIGVFRALPAGLLLLLIHRALPPLRWNRMLAISLCNISLFFVLLFIAAHRLPGSVAGTLGATLPLMVLLLQWVQEGKKPALSKLGLALLGLFGVVLLLNPSANLDPIGVAAALLGTLLMAQTSLWIARWPTHDQLGLAAWQLFLGGVILLPFAFMFAGAPALPTPKTWVGLIWLVVCNTAFAYWCWTRSVSLLGPHTMSMISLFNPVTAVLLGSIFLSERLSITQWSGIALIFISILLMKVIKTKPVVL